MQSVRFLRIGLIVAVIAGFIFTASVYASGKKDLAYLRSEENLRNRIESYNKYLNKNKFKKVMELRYSWKDMSKEERKEELEYFRKGEGSLFKRVEVTYNIETIKIIGDRAYVFLEISYLPVHEGRFEDIWIFDKDNWYLEESWSLRNDACKDLPIVFSNIMFEVKDFATVKISWDRSSRANSRRPRDQ